MKKVIIIIFSFFVGIKSVMGISASSYIVLDSDSNRVLLGHNIHEERLIASISKIMTCIIAVEKGDLNQKIKADESILKAVGSSIYIEIGETLTLEDLLYGMMLRSGNDASVLIANLIAGNMEKFQELMNDYAAKIGMKDTYFYNSHGLEEANGKGNTSSAYDMAILTSYAMKNETFRKIFGTKSYTTKSDKKTYVWKNKNKLLKYDFITGGKTGYTQKAKRTLVTSANINNMNIIIVTLNDGNDWNDHLSLYQNVKSNYQSVEIINPDDFELIDDTIFVNDTLYIKNNIRVTIKSDEIKQLKIKYYLLRKDRYENNEPVGDVKIYLKDQEITSASIYIKTSKFKKQSFWQKLINRFF